MATVTVLPGGNGAGHDERPKTTLDAEHAQVRSQPPIRLRLGGEQLVLPGGAGFALASLAAALSTSARMLIAARALLGVAAATLPSSSLALIRNMLVDEE